MRKHKTSNLLLAVCPECGKRVLHPRGKSDPKKAVWCHLECDACAPSGDKDYSITFYGEHGWMEYNGKKYTSPLLESHKQLNKINEIKLHGSILQK